MWPYRNLLFLVFLLLSSIAYGQQDVDMHLSNTFLNGKTILKVKRDFHDPYLWVLAKNNEVYRINSISLTVDDYTPQFAAYGNLQFVDIAGRSQDTVFVGTNSTNVIEYKKGLFKVISKPDGLDGNINELGMDHLYESFGGAGGDPLNGLPILMIATTANIYYYDCLNEKVYSTGLPPANNHLYETTYRTETYSDFGTLGFDPATQSTVIDKLRGTVYVGDIWHNTTEFGNNIYTDYYTTSDYLDDGNDYLYMDQLWGTENGLFENSFNSSYTTGSVYRHYLTGIKVNKVTSIYGLVAFPNPQGLTHQNMLVGTDNGFYFSSSGYWNMAPGAVRDYNTFTFDTEIGNQVINDVCVNATSYSPTICEDGVWVAGSKGLYYLKPDYGKYINSQNYQAAAFENMPTTTSSMSVCAGTSVNAVINNGWYTGNAIQWYKDGQELPGQSQNSLQINSAGDYYAVLYDPCSTIHIETNHLDVQIISAPVFSFNYPDKLQYCDSTSTTLQTDKNPQYQYRWYTNGILNGNTTNQYTVTTSGKYKVEVSACTNSWVPSKEIEVDLFNLPAPIINSDKSQYCAGDNALLTVNVPTDPGYSINWYKDGTLMSNQQDKTSIAADVNGNYSVTILSKVANCISASNTLAISFTPAPVFSFNYPDKLQYCAGMPVTLTASGSSGYQYRWYTNDVLNGTTGQTQNVTGSGKYKVEVSACTGSWVPSKDVEVDLITIPLPVIKTDKQAYCIGDNATMSIGIQDDPAYTINWYKDNVLVDSYKGQTSVTTNIAGNYSVIVTANNANTDGSICKQASTVQPLSFNPLPTVSIQQIIKNTLCDGQTVDLKVSYDNGAVQWSNGQSSDIITVSTSGSYTATVISTAGCEEKADVNVQFAPNPVLNIPNVGVCVPSHKVATIVAPNGMASYRWNGVPGTNVYTADHPQTITLTVTDANGCQATQDIQVSDECPNVNIPNAFTPNNDGINDTWEITGLEYDPTAMVKIFTRYGEQVYESRGYSKPWDGTFKGKKLQAGTYYYIINAKNDTQTYSGYLTIIY